MSNSDILPGAEFQAVVEYAPSQKTPLKTKVKVDNRQGTIDEGAFIIPPENSTSVHPKSTDPDYLSFIESLNAPVAKPALEVAGTYIHKQNVKAMVKFEIASVTQPTTTPLLEHLRSQKSASKSKSKAAKAAQNQSQSSAAAPESARRAAALASINAASQRRGGQANAGPVMVAGKGREVMITPSSTPPVPDSGKQKQQGEQQAEQGAKHEQTDKEKKSRGGRKRNKGKDKQKEGVNGVSSGQQTPSVQPTSSTTPQAHLSSRPVQPARIDNSVSNMLSQNQSIPPPKTTSGSARAPQAPAGKSGTGAGSNGEPRSSESGRGRQRGGRGRGGGGQPKTSSAGPQVKILSRNPVPPAGPGPRRGDKGGAASDAGAAFARIDM